MARQLAQRDDDVDRYRMPAATSRKSKVGAPVKEKMAQTLPSGRQSGLARLRALAIQHGRRTFMSHAAPPRRREAIGNVV